MTGLRARGFETRWGLQQLAILNRTTEPTREPLCFGSPVISLVATRLPLPCGSARDCVHAWHTKP